MSSTTNRYNLQIFDWSTDTTRSFIDGLAGLTDSNMQKLEDVIGDIEDIVTSSIQLERVEISSGVDLNSLNDINKVYVSTNDTIAEQCTNIPKSTINSFELRTYKTTYSQDSKCFMQILKTYTNELWIRGCNVDVWTEWKQMATNDDIETINNNIDNINTNIDNINDDITTRINNSIDEINDTINEINTDINSSIDTINTNLTRATERIDTNANNIATNTTNITNLTNTMDSFMDDVAMTYATQSELNELAMDIGDNVKPAITALSNNMSNYPTNSDLDTKLSNYETHVGISNKLNNYVTKTNFNNAIGGMLTISQANGTYATQIQANSNTTEINNLKSTVVSGKTSVANAINGKLGTTLSNQTSFADMAYYIGTIPILSIENLYVGGSYLSTPSGVGIKYVIFNTISKSTASSHDSGYVTAEFTNNAQNAYRIVVIKGNHNGTRNVTTLNPKTITKTGTVTANLSFPEASSDVGTMITIAIFDNPIYDVKALTGNAFICIP